MRWFEHLASRCEFKVLHDRERLVDPYLIRYTVFKTQWFAVYLHRILRSDSTADYHDHPWAFAHLILEGRYIEETPSRPARRVRPGSFAIRGPRYAHRLELIDGEVWTLVIVGRKRRQWGFVGRRTGCWLPWDRYVFSGERCE